MIVALLTAAGNGSRMHQDIPKQFMHIDNKPVIIHTLERFQNHPSIDAIIVVTLESWIDVLWAYAKQFGITKLRWVISGGSTGQESICRGVRELERHCSQDDVVVIHDGNRCLVSSEIISNSLAVFSEKGSAVAAIPCVEAVFQSKDGLSSTKAIPREELLRTQTPHTFSLGKLSWAHNEARRLKIENMAATCSLMERLGETVFFSRGSEENIKITTTEDIKIFKSLLHAKQEPWLK